MVEAKLAGPTSVGTSTTGVVTIGTRGDADALRPVVQQDMRTTLNRTSSSLWSEEEALIEKGPTEPLSPEILLTEWLSPPDELKLT